MPWHNVADALKARLKADAAPPQEPPRSRDTLVTRNPAQDLRDAGLLPSPQYTASVPDTPLGRICTQCGTTMVQRFDYHQVNDLAVRAIPNGLFDCMKCGATAPPQEPPKEVSRG